MQGESTFLASYLAGDFISKTQSSREMILVTGASGRGKTTWCQNAAIQARMEGLPVAGLLSPATYRDGRKTEIALVDLKTGQRKVLATPRLTAPGDGGMAWDFRQAAIDWANEVLRAITSDETVFIDELGPLELVRGGGFQEGLKLLDAERYSSAFVVVRPSLLPVAMERWSRARVLDLEENAP